MASTFDEYGTKIQTPSLYFISSVKDITYFHCLFWAAMLESAGFRKPTG